MVALQDQNGQAQDGVHLMNSFFKRRKKIVDANKDVLQKPAEFFPS